MRVLLVFGTTEGFTQKLAEYIADRLRSHGNAVEIANAGDRRVIPEPDEFDAVIVAASVHVGRYQPEVLRFVREHAAALDERLNAFLSVSLAAAGNDEGDVRGLKECLATFTRQTGWTPRYVHHVAGALRYTAYDFLKRWGMRYIAYRKGGPTDISRDHELTDWSDVARFVDTLSARTQSPSKERVSGSSAGMQSTV
jgi:menaquinone-dependent protoporphyrinogen oxidase